MDELAKSVIKDWERRDAVAGSTLSHWQQVTNYLHPDRADYTTVRSPGQKRMQYVFDGYPIWAREQYRAALHSFLTSPTILWFSMVPDDDRLRTADGVMTWLDQATLAMYAVFNSARYNFASQSQETYDDLGDIGTACMAIVEGKNGMPRFSTRHMAECRWEQNDEDRVDKLSRRWQWTADQAYAKWGAAAGEGVRKAIADGKGDSKFWFHHRVGPRLKRDTQRADRLHMAFESIYVAEADQTRIDVGGMNEFVYITPVVSRSSGEVYGRGAGTTSHPDVKMLNEAKKLVIKAAQKIIDPPLELPDDGYIVPIRTVPGSLIFRRPGLRPDDRIQAVKTEANIGIGNDLLQALRNDIGRNFLVDLVHMPTDPENPQGDGKGSTATYWVQRQRKEMMALSPFLSRMNEGWSGPCIDRVFAILWRKSVKMKFGPGSPFPPPPPALSGQQLHVEYVSPLALAQRSSEGDAIDRLISRQLQLRQLDPQSPLILDVDFIMRRTQMDENSPAGALKTKDQLAQEAQLRQEQEQAAAQHAAIANLAGAAKDGTAAVKNIADAQRGGAPANDASSGQEAA